MSSDLIIGFLLGSLVGGVSVWKALFDVRKETKAKEDHLQRISDKIDADLRKLYPKDYQQQKQ